ncbi:E3 ubiquitin-protein ligase UBR1 isoform X1 [Stigmatopora argus]
MAEAKQPFDEVELLKEWQASADLKPALYDYLRTWVPQIYCYKAESNLKEEEEQVQRQLLRPLECFLFGEDPDEGVKKFKQSTSSSQLCGRVFKEGETVYSCRDCAIDPTCVLCMDCFQESVHKNHRYKMHASSGGGFCDCGDVEAWKIGPCCSKHDPEATTAMVTNDCSLEPELCQRVETLFRVLLNYFTDFMDWAEGQQLLGLLKPEEKENTFFCMLYNDEHHSYDHVIYTLQRSVNCDQSEAQNYMALIDKEGRRAVKKGSLESCEQAKELIKYNSEHISLQPLHVEVLHSSVVAHQTFALRLGLWFQQIIGYSVGFRQAFCRVAMEPNAEPTNICCISRLMLLDAKLYKGARKIVHELIFCSLLMETEFKRLFAIEFTKLYKDLQHNFIDDDHERSISITLLSVQIFTVPTLARYLIEETNVITRIVNTVMALLMEHLDVNNRFFFLGYNSEKFSRIQVIFHDLRYILISIPSTWSCKLRKQFKEGFNAFLGLLKCMQGMEEVMRQFGQHIAVEPEWEAGFALQIQLRHILAMFQDWCASDDKILLEAFRDCHRVLQQSNNQPFSKEATDHYICKQILNLRPYKVSQEPVSIHLPLSRLLAGLYVLICKNGLCEQLFIKECYDFSQLAEHPLRCVVLAAQVSAEMWRRNGLSLVSQVYYYQDVRCREEMYDKDILMLQIAASRMDANHFIMLLLIRFELLSYFNEGYFIRDHVPNELLSLQWNRLSEEMLYLIIVIVGERYIPGVTNVTKEDVTMREVIHLLCIEPMAHSSLVKGLPDNESHETGLESVIDSVATFKKPGVSGHGLYEVKREHLVHFNPFFYHYSKSQHSKAEESQKKRRVHEGADKALRPPVPPPFCPAFSNIVNLLCCDVLVHILKCLLQRAAEEKSNLWSEIMIQRALHIIGQALLEEKRQLEEDASEDVAFDFSLKARRVEHNKSLFLFLSKIKGVRLLETQKDMVTWLLQMFQIIKCLREKSSPTTSMSMETSKPEESVQDKEKAERKRKAEAAKLHRQKIMAQMSAMQKNFIESNKMLYENMPESGMHGEPVTLMESAIEQKELRVAIGPQRGSTPAEREVLTCILCQEEQEVASRAPAMVLTACVQRSTVLTQCRGKMPTSSEDETAASYPLFMPPDLVVGTHTGSCGHVMHATCWQKYFEAVQSTSRNRLHTELIIDLENGEYLCPLCKSLCNTVVPLIPLEPLVFNYENAEIIGQHLTLTRWIHILDARIKGLQSLTQDNDCNMETINEGDATLCGESQTDFRAILSYGVQEPRKLSDGIVEMLAVCATTVHRVGLQTAPNELCPRVPLMAWNTCAFTVQAIENILYDKPLFGSLQNRQLAGLKAIVQFSAAERIKSPQAVIQRHFTDMLAVLLPVISRKNTPSILEVDFFHLLVGLVLSLPSLYQEETVDLQPSPVSSAYNHLYIVHLVTMAHVLQVMLLATDLPVVVGDEETEEARTAAELHAVVSQHTGRPLPEVPGSAVAQRVKTGIESFLRCAALFFSCLTGVRPPEELSCSTVSSQGQMEALCSYLALPSNVFQLFQEHKDTVAPLLHRWCSSPAVTKGLKGKTQTVRYPRRRNRLIDLPEDYSTLLNQASHFQCPKSADDERKHPTLCLFCGAMLCSQSSCCLSQLEGEVVGACTAHAATCGAGVGMFLRVRECEIVLMASKTRGSTYPAPYLDDYGETDPHLGRGNPLHLCPERYRKLKQMWKQHCILEEIARSLELVNVMFAFDWQML